MQLLVSRKVVSSEAISRIHSESNCERRLTAAQTRMNLFKDQESFCRSANPLFSDSHFQAYNYTFGVLLQSELCECCSPCYCQPETLPTNPEPLEKDRAGRKQIYGCPIACKMRNFDFCALMKTCVYKRANCDVLFLQGIPSFAQTGNVSFLLAGCTFHIESTVAVVNIIEFGTSHGGRPSLVNGCEECSNVPTRRSVLCAKTALDRNLHVQWVPDRIIRFGCVQNQGNFITAADVEMCAPAQICSRF